MLCIDLLWGLRICFVCAVVLSAACLVTSIGGPVVTLCKDHVTLIDLCQAVWQLSKSQRMSQTEKMLANLCHTLQ